MILCFVDTEFLSLLETIYRETQTLVQQFVDKGDCLLEADYLCVFPKNNKEYTHIKKLAESLGRVIQRSATGDWVWLDKPVKTQYGWIRMIRIYQFDPSKIVRGYADYAVSDYTQFKQKYLDQKNFSLIHAPTFEMVELKDPAYDGWVYFPDTPLSQDLGLK